MPNPTCGDCVHYSGTKPWCDWYAEMTARDTVVRIRCTVGRVRSVNTRNEPFVECYAFERVKLLDAQEEEETVVARLRRLHEQARSEAEELTDGTPDGLDRAGVFLRIAEVIRRELEGLER